MTRWRTEYTGPVRNRGEDAQGRALVSAEELADFRRKYGADKTLRELLNADRTGKTPSSAESPRARGAQGANIAPEQPNPYDDRSRVLEGVAAKQREMLRPGRDAVEGVYPEVALLPAAKLGQTAAQALQAARGAKTAGNWRERAPEGADPAKWRDIVQKLDEAYPGGAAPFKKGGKVKTYAKGGVTRADGCAQRGKTRGRML